MKTVSIAFNFSFTLTDLFTQIILKFKQWKSFVRIGQNFKAQMA